MTLTEKLRVETDGLDSLGATGSGEVFSPDVLDGLMAKVRSEGLGLLGEGGVIAGSPTGSSKSCGTGSPAHSTRSTRSSTSTRWWRSRQRPRGLDRTRQLDSLVIRHPLYHST